MGVLGSHFSSSVKAIGFGVMLGVGDLIFIRNIKNMTQQKEASKNDTRGSWLLFKFGPAKELVDVPKAVIKWPMTEACQEFKRRGEPGMRIRTRLGRCLLFVFVLSS